MNIGDGIDYHQRHTENVGDLIQVKFIKTPTANLSCCLPPGDSGADGEERWSRRLHQHKVYDPHLRVLHHQEALNISGHLGNKYH